MNEKQLFIPDKIKVGYVKRDGTYTGKLAYVIYYDNKGKLRKEVSWEGWRDKKIAPHEFSNEPTEGFVLNKGVGGQRHSYGWNARNEYIRVYDPRDFEFEISVANLLFILRECDCSRGKGLEGKFVYAWDGTELVLLPAVCQDYKNSKQFTELQSQGVKTKDLIPGASYVTKRQEILTFVGRFDYHFMVKPDGAVKKDASGVEKKYIFHDGKKYVLLNDVKTIGILNSAEVATNFAELVDGFNKSKRGSKVVKLFLKEKAKEEEIYRNNPTWFSEENGTFVEWANNYDWEPYKYDQPKKDRKQYLSSIYRQNKYSINDKGVFVCENYMGYCVAPNSHHPDNYRCKQWYNYQSRSHEDIPNVNWQEPTRYELWAEFENGKKAKVDNNMASKSDNSF